MHSPSPRVLRLALAALLLPSALAAQAARPAPATNAAPSAAMDDAARRRYTEMMTDAARHDGLAVDVARLEYVSTRDGVLVIVPTAAAVAGEPAADGKVMMLAWYSIGGEGARPVTGFFQVAQAAMEGSRLPAPRRAAGVAGPRDRVADGRRRLGRRHAAPLQVPLSALHERRADAHRRHGPLRARLAAVTRV